MNRDAIFATAIGFSIGLVITGVILIGPGILSRVSQLSLKKPLNPTSPTTTPGTKTLDTQGSLVISSPIPGEIVSSNSLIISGVAKAGRVIVAQSGNEDVVMKVDESGKFAAKMSLSIGKNDIIVGMHGEEGESEYKTLTVFYTPEEF